MMSYYKIYGLLSGHRANLHRYTGAKHQEGFERELVINIQRQQPATVFQCKCVECVFVFMAALLTVTCEGG